MNLVILIGYVGADPEVRETQNSKVANIRLATSERYKDKNGEYQDATEWHRLVIWGATANYVQQYVKKGDRLSVQGKLTTRSYEKDGETKYITEVRVFKLDNLSPKKSAPATPEPEQAATAGDDGVPF